MPDEPNKPMDELLKSYAQKRREEAGAPLEMHPATRKILQDEVARLRPEPVAPGKSFSALMTWLIPKLVIGVSVAVVVIAAVVLLKPSAHAPQQMAKNVETRDAARAPQSMPAAEAKEGERLAGDAFGVPKPEERARVEVQSKLKLNEPAPAVASDHEKLEHAALAAADKQATNLGDETKTLAFQTEQLSKEISSAKLDSPPLKLQVTNGIASPLPGAPPTTAAPASSAPVLAGTINGTFYDNVTASEEAGSASGPQRRQFSRLKGIQPTASKDASASSLTRGLDNVLANFQIEQTGDRVRILDADGSTYEGNVSGVETRGGRVAAARKSAGEKTEDTGGRTDLFTKRESNQPISFRVTGTNRTVNQIVVFDGTVVAGTNTLSLSDGRFRAKASQGAAGGERSILLGPSRIQGRARVGTANEIEIDAVPSQ